MHEDIFEVILSGGCSLMQNFSSVLAERTGIQTRVVEPFKNIRIPKKFENADLDQMAPMMAVAVGLALRKQGDR